VRLSNGQLPPLTKRKDETKARLAFATRQPARENMRLRKALLVIQIGIACFCLSLSAASAQIVALGASNTAGYGLSSSQSWPAQLQAMLQAKGSATKVINAGISGDTSAGIFSRIGSAVPEGTRIVILSVFAYNDNRKGISPAEHQANVAAIERQLRSRGIRIINANGLIQSALKAGMVQGDGIHLTAEGCRRVAMGLLGSVR
jgi:acyl-CoA thioesterase I